MQVEAAAIGAVQNAKAVTPRLDFQVRPSRSVHDGHIAEEADKPEWMILGSGGRRVTQLASGVEQSILESQLDFIGTTWKLLWFSARVPQKIETCEAGQDIAAGGSKGMIVIPKGPRLLGILVSVNVLPRTGMTIGTICRPEPPVGSKPLIGVSIVTGGYLAAVLMRYDWLRPRVFLTAVITRIRSFAIQRHPALGLRGVGPVERLIHLDQPLHPARFVGAEGLLVAWQLVYISYLGRVSSPGLDRYRGPVCRTQDFAIFRIRSFVGPCPGLWNVIGGLGQPSADKLFMPTGRTA